MKSRAVIALALMAVCILSGCGVVELQEEKAALQKQLVLEASKVEALEENLRTARKEIEDSNSRINDIEVQITSLTQLSADRAEELAAAEKARDEAVAALQAMESSEEVFYPALSGADLPERLENLESERDLAAAELTGLKARAEADKKTIEALRKQLADATTEISTLEEESAAFRSEIQKSRTEAARSAMEIFQANATSEALAAQLEQANDKVENLTQANERITEQVNSLRQQLDAARAELDKYISGVAVVEEVPVGEPVESTPTSPTTEQLNASAGLYEPVTVESPEREEEAPSVISPPESTSEETTVTVVTPPPISNLYEAIDASSLYALDTLIAQGEDVNGRDDEGRSPFLYASYKGADNAVEALRIAGANIEAKDYSGNTAMHLAAAAGNMYTINTLYAYGLDRNSQNDDLNTPLHIAVKENQPNSVTALLKILARVDISNSEDSYTPPLRYAIQLERWDCTRAFYDMGQPYTINDAAVAGDLPMLEYLTSQNPMIMEEATEVHGFTPLHSTIIGDKLQCFEFLLNHGANMVSNTRAGVSTLGLAIQYDRKEFVDMLLERGFPINYGKQTGRGDSALHFATEWGKLDYVEYLLDHGAQVDVTNKTGSTALHTAVLRNRPAIAKLLIERGAPIEKRDNQFCTAFAVAARENRTQLMELLLENGANMEEFGGRREHYRAVHYAVMNRHIPALRFLIEHGANLNQQDNFKRTALHYAVENSAPVIAKMLIEGGAKTSFVDENGDTPLLVAAAMEKYDCAKLLLGSGADLNERNQKGQSALHLALLSAHSKMSELMHDAGLGMDLKDDDGCTPLHAAVEGEARKLAKVLRGKYGNVDLRDPPDEERIPAEESAENAHLVEWVLDQGADLYAVDKKKRTALHYAADGAGINTIELLIKKGLEVNDADNDGLHPIHYAARRGHLAYVDTLLNHGADVDVLDQQHRLPLHYAAMGFGWRVLQTFVTIHGLDVNTVDDLGNTPLLYGSINADNTVMKILLRLEADTIVHNKQGYTPLDYVMAKLLDEEPRKSWSLEELFASEILKDPVLDRLYTKIVETLITAAKNGEQDDVLKVVDIYPGLVSSVGEDGKSSFHYAAEWGDLLLLKKMVEAGALLEQFTDDSDQYTALHIAARAGHKDAVEFLLAKGVSPLIENIKGVTPQSLAEKEGHTEVVKLLTEYKAKVSVSR